ncbi:MAG: sugar transporter, partial [Bacteroidia bacterium]|nr:sugar transporter [Bacteroidia bacterium]
MKQLKFTLTLVAIMLFASSVFSQAKWDFKTKKINDSISELQLKVKLGDGWHIYSQYTKGTELPIVFEF